MKIRCTLLAFLALTLAVWAPLPATAQETTTTQTPETARDTSSILRAIALPALSELLRERGVPAEEIEATIRGARERGVPADEAAVIMEETAATVDEHGPIEDFGGFVQSRLEAGLRGRELAEAIRAEHARRGIGQGMRIEGRRQGPPEGRGPGQGRPEDAGRPGDAGPPGDVGPGQRGAGAADTADRGPGQQGGPPGMDSIRRGPPEGRGPGARRPDSVPDSIQRRRGGGNGGGA